MQWLNIKCSTLDSEEFLGSTPGQRATWLCLLRYCVGQENGGTIVNCRDWSGRKWEQLCRVTKEEVMCECDLWRWWGDMGSLRVWEYPMRHQEQAERNRGMASKAAETRWAKRHRNGSKPPKPKSRPKKDETDPQKAD